MISVNVLQVYIQRGPLKWKVINYRLLGSCHKSYKTFTVKINNKPGL